MPNPEKQPHMVSVIIPNYNHATYLQQRIDTVLHQTYQDFEVIILDDCSTDGSRSIIEAYRHHPKVTCIVYNDTNSGNTFRQWIKGIEMCRGEYVWIAESDDWCDRSLLENLLTGMLEAGNCVIGYCQSYCIEDTNVIKWQSAHGYLNDWIEGEAFIERYMLTGTAIFNASMAVWKKDAFPLISKEFAQYRFCGDWLFWIELCMHGRVYVSGKLLNYFRKHNSNLSRKAVSSGENFVEELNMFMLLRNTSRISQKSYLASVKSIYINYKGAESSLHPSMRKQIKDIFFREPEVRNHVRSFYLVFYIKYAVRKIFNAIIS